MAKNIYNIGKELFITNDEEIKEGDWVKNISFEEPIFKLDGKGITYVTLVPHLKFNKIILTTDQALIAEGIQQIDNEFLEWFVKNPSCEEVEVYREGYKKNGMIDEATSYQYKIIIPKEEPRYIMGFDPYDEPKQEALEDKLKSLVEEWRKRQLHYEEVAEDNITSEHNNRKFTYKAMATRDCWKELLKLIEYEK